MNAEHLNFIQSELQKIHKSGLWKEERILSGQQSARVNIVGRENVLNMCANNYLGLADHLEIIKAAKDSFDKWGYGLSSVRFICGTQEIHKQLETKISQFLDTDDTILYSSCFDANGGIFEVLLSDQDAVITDELNHASIIDGVRLCKAARYRYKNNDMKDLEEKLKEAQNSRFRLIVTDGVFSMDGFIADLKSICDLADRYNALVMVDDSHAVGFVGEKGRGTHEHCGVMGRVDVITGTLGKALGGASGGYVSGRKEIIDLLRQRSRPYLFSNTLAPSITAAAIKTLELLTESTHLRDKLAYNTQYYREGLKKAEFSIPEGIHSIVPIIVGDANIAQKMSSMLLEKGIYATAFSYPVVPLGKARIRTQVSAAHTVEDLDYVIKSFVEIREVLKF
ncbi:MAG: glycine C-acetyltransferase [Bacillota bacterium]